METLREMVREQGWTDEDLGRGWKVNGRWTVRPARYIEDREEWESKHLNLQDVLPDGATVTLTQGEQSHEARVEYKGHRILFHVPALDMTINKIGADTLYEWLDAISLDR